MKTALLRGNLIVLICKNRTTKEVDSTIRPQARIIL